MSNDPLIVRFELPQATDNNLINAAAFIHVVIDYFNLNREEVIKLFEFLKPTT